MRNLREYVTVASAAELLGVAPKSFREWDCAVKLKPVRHALNRYRLYLRIKAFPRKLAEARAQVAII